MARADWETVENSKTVLGTRGMCFGLYSLLACTSSRQVYFQMAGDVFFVEFGDLFCLDLLLIAFLLFPLLLYDLLPVLLFLHFLASHCFSVVAPAFLA